MKTPVITAAPTLCAAGVTCAAVLGSPPAQADVVAYLINVTVRPGYNFANADDAVTYGRRVCAGIDSGQSHAAVMTQVKSDFNNPDEYQPSYLIAQSVNEPCPARSWRLRNSGANYRPPGP